MKKIIIFALISITISLSGCSEDDILGVENRNSLSIENFWQDQRDAEAGIYSVYSALQFNGSLGGTATVAFPLLSEAGRIGNINRGTDRLQLDDALVNSTNPAILAQWQDIYQIVFRANQVITNVPNIDMDETAKKEILGEAYFLRSLAMFWCATTFNNGNVPYPLITPTNLEEARFPIKERSFVYNQIIGDLLIAQTNLEDRMNWSDENLEGRATWGAVTSILGKVYLYEENFTRARQEFLKVIESNEYELTPDIGENFTEEGEFNSESIFEVQFFANIDNGGNFGDGEGDQPNESTLRPTLISRTSGFGFVFATHFISSLYRNEVIDPNLPINQESLEFYDEGYSPNASSEENERFTFIGPRILSSRAMASVAFEGDATLYYTNSTREFFIRVFSRAQFRKFSNWTESGEARNSGINERVIRLADVYLMYAEALLRDQGNAGVTEALTYINLVRQRSGLITLETLFSGVPISPIVRNTFPDLDVRPLQHEVVVLNEELNSTPPPIPARIAEINARIMQIETTEIPAIENSIVSMNATIHPSLTIQPQALNANNILRHLFNKERPAEFAWEGRGISWHDLRRRPASIGDAIQRIQELGDIRYTATTLDVQPFEELPQFVENTLQDFQNRKVNFNQDDLSFPIPAQEVLQNPNLGGGN